VCGSNYSHEALGWGVVQQTCYVANRRTTPPPSPLPQGEGGTRAGDRERTAGFSLLELIVVLAVLALAAALVAPRIPIASRAIALKAEARAIQAAMEEAGAGALATRRAQSVALDLAAMKLRGASQERALDPEIAITATFGQTPQAGAQVARFTFFPDGTSTGGRVTLRRGHQAIAVEANWLTGAVRSFHVKAD